MDIKTLTVYHTNDLHNNDSILDVMKELPKDDSTLLLDAGDALKGSNTMFYPTEPILKKMNDAGYDVMAMGNREIHYVRKVLQNRCREADFPILAANVEDDKKVVDECFPSSTIIERAGIKIGIFGLTVVQYPENSFWFPLFRLRFFDPIETSRKMVEKLRDKVDLLILLSHQGIKLDRLTAGKVKGIDLIIGGHTHTLLEKPEYVKGIPIFQAGAFGRHYGKISIPPDEKKGPDLKKLKYEIIDVSKR